MSSGPVEAKVTYATVGAAIAGVLIWALETYLFRGVVPLPVQALIDIAVPALSAFGFGYAARHTFRNDPDARKGQETPPGAPPAR
jgi:hypothetical protein